MNTLFYAKGISVTVLALSFLSGYCGDLCDNPRASEYKKAAVYAMASKYAYSKNEGDLPPGFLPTKDPDDTDILNFSGISFSVLTNATTGEVIVSFRGTDNIVDILNDAGQGLAGLSPQYFQARQVASMLHAKYGDHLVATGHSLGGGEASYVGTALDIPFYTFNAAPLHPNTLGAGELVLELFENHSDGFNYYHENDLVFKIPGLHPGTEVELTESANYPTLDGPGISDLFPDWGWPDIGGTLGMTLDAAKDAHSIDQMNDHLKKYLDCPRTAVPHDPAEGIAGQNAGGADQDKPGTPQGEDSGGKPSNNQARPGPNIAPCFGKSDKGQFEQKKSEIMAELLDDGAGLILDVLADTAKSDLMDLVREKYGVADLRTLDKLQKIGKNLIYDIPKYAQYINLIRDSKEALAVYTEYKSLPPAQQDAKRGELVGSLLEILENVKGSEGFEKSIEGIGIAVDLLSAAEQWQLFDPDTGKLDPAVLLSVVDKASEIMLDIAAMFSKIPGIGTMVDGWHALKDAAGAYTAAVAEYTQAPPECFCDDIAKYAQLFKGMNPKEFNDTQTTLLSTGEQAVMMDRGKNYTTSLIMGSDGKPKEAVVRLDNWIPNCSAVEKARKFGVPVTIVANGIAAAAAASCANGSDVHLVAFNMAAIPTFGRTEDSAILNVVSSDAFASFFTLNSDLTNYMMHSPGGSLDALIAALIECGGNVPTIPTEKPKEPNPLPFPERTPDVAKPVVVPKWDLAEGERGKEYIRKAEGNKITPFAGTFEDYDKMTESQTEANKAAAGAKGNAVNLLGVGDVDADDPK